MSLDASVDGGQRLTVDGQDDASAPALGNQVQDQVRLIINWLLQPYDCIRSCGCPTPPRLSCMPAVTEMDGRAFFRQVDLCAYGLGLLR